MNTLKNHWKSFTLAGLCLILVMALLLSGIQIKPTVTYNNVDGQPVIYVGDPGDWITFSQVEAVTTEPDFSGLSSTVVQQAVNSLPTTGGVIQLISPVYTFTATVSRAINNVTIRGMNGTTVNYNGTDPVFSAGSQTGWKFEDLKTDAGGITQAADTMLIHVTVNATHYGVLADSLVATSLEAPTGGTATLVIAAADATDEEKARADVVCKGDSTDAATINALIDSVNATGAYIKFTTGTFNSSLPVHLFGTAGNKNNMVYEGSGYATVFKIPDEIKESLTVDGILGDTVLHVADASVFVIGMEVGVSDSADWHAYTLTDVDSVANTVTINIPLVESRLVADSACVINISRMFIANKSGYKFTLMNMCLDFNKTGQSDYWVNVGWNDDGTPNDYYKTGLYVIHAANIEVSGCWFKDIYFNGYLATPENPNAMVHHNYFTSSQTTMQARAIASEGGCHGSVIADNVINYTGIGDTETVGIYITEDFQTVSRNTIYGTGGSAIRLRSGIGHAVEDNILYCPGGYGVLTDTCIDYRISRNTIYNAAGSAAILANISDGFIDSNTIIGGATGITLGTSSISVINNKILNFTSVGIELLSANNSYIDNNKIIGTTGSLYGISFNALSPSNGVYVTNNRIKGISTSLLTAGIYERKTSAYYGNEGNYYWGNYIQYATTALKVAPDAGQVRNARQTTIYSEQHIDTFTDVLGVVATHVRSNEDLSEAIPNTFTIDLQPDVPRTLSGHFDAHANITAYTIVIRGTDASGLSTLETKTEADGWDWETNQAFATITSIIMTARTGTGAGDTMDIGITDVLGLSNKILEIADVYKIKKGQDNQTVATAQVSATYYTYDMSVIGLADGDDITIWYRTNLNRW
jgi:hypothetical protein